VSSPPFIESRPSLKAVLHHALHVHVDAPDGPQLLLTRLPHTPLVGLQEAFAHLEHRRVVDLLHPPAGLLVQEELPRHGVVHPVGGHLRRRVPAKKGVKGGGQLLGALVAVALQALQPLGIEDAAAHDPGQLGLYTGGLRSGGVGGEARHERPEGVRSFHMDLSHPPERPPGGIVAKQRSGWALGRILCLAGKSITFGNLPVPESSPVI